MAAPPRRILKPRLKHTEDVRHPYENDPLPLMAKQMALEMKGVNTKIIDSTTNCKPFALTTAIMATIYSHMRAQVLCVLYGYPEEEARVASGLVASRPWATVDHIKITRDILIKAAIEDGHRISMRFSLSLRKRCALDNLMLLVTMSEAVAHYGSPERVKECMTFIAEHQPWLVENNIAIVSSEQAIADEKTPPTPVLSYRNSQLQRAVHQLGERWDKLVWDNRIPAYVRLLLVRCGVLMTATFPGLVNDAIGTISVRKKGLSFVDSEVEVTERFVWLVSDVFYDTLKKMSMMASCRTATPQTLTEVGIDRPSYWLRLRKHFVAWVERKLGEINTSEPSDLLKDHILQLSVRPGEVSAYSRTNPATSNLSEVQYVISKNREVQFRELTRQKGRTYAEVIKNDFLTNAKLLEGEMKKEPRLRPTRPFAPETHVVALCLLELIKSHCASRFPSVEFKNYYVIETDLHDRLSDLDAQEYPIMVQMFNYFQVSYNKEVIICNSFMLSFLVWCSLIRRKQRNRLNGLKIREWFKEIAPLEVWDDNVDSSDEESSSDGSSGEHSSEASSSASSSGSTPLFQSDADDSSSMDAPTMP